MSFLASKLIPVRLNGVVTGLKAAASFGGKDESEKGEERSEYGTCLSSVADIYTYRLCSMRIGSS